MGGEGRGRWAPRLNARVNFVFDLLGVAAVWWGLMGMGARGLEAAAISAAAWGAGAFVVRFYDPWGNQSWLDELALACLVDGGVVVALLIVGLFGMHWHLRVLAAPAFLAVLTLVTLPRWLLFRRFQAREPAENEVLIVGVGALGRSTAETLATPGHQRSRVIGFLRLPGDGGASEQGGLPVLGSAEELERVVRERAVSEVYLAADPIRHARAIQNAIRDCERFGLPFALPACCFRLGRARPAHPNAVIDGYVHYVSHDSRPYQRAVKRLFDIVASFLALLLLSPLLLTVAALIKLTSKGPVFFKQQRVGLHGRAFHMLKFRTMIPNADAMKDQLQALNEQKGPVFKIKNDPRITPLGRFLRKHSIDELPQLLNVLRGDMSVVGPRPRVPREVAQYQPWQRRRLSVRPGLTCIWQVSGRNQITFDEWMYLDMRYIDHWSFGQDLRLVLKTIPVVLTGSGAS
jgi:exopolysaccharide biosynthesis polyprenyl glycosylphosphotransferase